MLPNIVHSIALETGRGGEDALSLVTSSFSTFERGLMVAAFLVKKFQASAVVADTDVVVGISWLILAQQQTRTSQRI